MPIYAGSTRNEESSKHNFEKHTEIKTKDVIEPPRTGSYQPEILLHSFLKKKTATTVMKESLSLGFQRVKYTISLLF